MMTGPAYFNEIDPFAVAWLRNLIAAGHLPAGDVDARSIADLRPADIPPGPAHFFAGIGGWPLALRMAGLSDGLPIWTGSPPCQPFSVAGKQKGYDDDRHLAPAWLALVRECRPAILFGEQVASPAGRAWLADLRAALEAMGYAVGAADLCAAGVGAPHIRQRLYFGAVRLADCERARLEGHARNGDRGAQPGRHAAQAAGHAAAGGVSGRLADRDGNGCPPRRPAAAPTGHVVAAFAGNGAGDPGARHGGWANADWLFCRDGKWRPVESGTFPLADGVSARVGRLRGYGNAILPALAAEFVSAFLEAAAEIGWQGVAP